MLLLWDLYWPAWVAALAIGVATGVIADRRSGRRDRLLVRAAGIAAVLTATGLWHGPIGTAEQFRSGVEARIDETLEYYEMGQVQAGLESGPLGRTLLLSGQADDFQRSELIRILGYAPGVAGVRWQDSGQGSSHPLPLIAEVELWSLVAFGLGLLLAYLIELRRRARAEWRW